MPSTKRLTHIYGADVVEEILKQLPGRIVKNVTLGALRAGAAVIAKQARENIKNNPSIDSGLLLKNISSRARRRRSDRKSAPLVVSVGVVRGATALVTRKGSTKPVKASPARYAHIVENGREGVPAEPFMRPAIDAKGAEAAAKVMEALAKGVEKESRALAAGTKSFITGKRI